MINKRYQIDYFCLIITQITKLNLWRHKLLWHLTTKTILLQ